ncbi:MAG: right-handed parallel beta-helix repeat-containing protein [Thermoplasmata archaeon]
MRKKIVMLVVVLLLTSALISGLSYSVVDDDSNKILGEESEYEGSGIYASHAPIRIDDNSELAAEASSGSGTENDPYIIEGYEIDGGGEGYCVYIGNTTDYYVLRDCYLYNASSYGEHGVHIYYSVNGRLKNNTVINNYYGIHLDELADNNRLDENNVSSNSDLGIHLYNSDNNLIENNNVSNNGKGIYISYSHNTQISNNTAFSNHDEGIYVSDSDNNEVYNNTASNSIEGNGITLARSDRNTIPSNIASSNYGHGIRICDGSTKNTISNNNLTSNGNGGINLDDSDSNTLVENHMSSNDQYGIEIHRSSVANLTSNEMIGEGIYISGSDLIHWNTHTIDTLNTVNGNSVQYWKNETSGTIPSDSGEVILANCSEVTVEDQNVSDANVGILLGFSDNNTVSRNTAIENSDYGIYLYQSKYNILTDNDVSSNYRGLYLDLSNDNTMINITASYNENNGIYLYDSISNSFSNCTMTSNEADGIELDYFSNNNILENNNASSSNTGSGIHLSQSSRNEISHTTASDNSGDGIYLYESNNNSFIDNDLTENGDDGISLSSSSHDNILRSNSASSNSDDGIVIWESSSRNTLVNNTVSSNNFDGIRISGSIENTFTNNTVSFSGQYGIYVYNSNNNTIYHNNFIDNTDGGYDDGTNTWNASYPTGGNYWSDYSGYDNYKGPNQDEPGSDGIGDSNYTIETSNADEYPLMSPTNTDTYSLDLSAGGKSDGWQFISFPMIPHDESIEDVLNYIDGNYDKVMYYDSTDDQWESTIMNRTDHYNNLEKINHTMGFWVHMTSDDTLVIEGNKPVSTDIVLEPGWNMVGYPSGTNRTAEEVLPSEISKLGLYNPDKKYNLDYVYSGIFDDILLKRENGYWVYNDADYSVNWTVDY